MQTGRGKQVLEVDVVLFAIGRTPNVKSLNLEEAKVEYNETGIIVN